MGALLGKGTETWLKDRSKCSSSGNGKCRGEGEHQAWIAQESQLSPASLALPHCLLNEQQCCWLETCSLQALKVAAGSNGGFRAPSQDRDPFPAALSLLSTQLQKGRPRLFWNQSLQGGGGVPGPALPAQGQTHKRVRLVNATRAQRRINVFFRSNLARKCLFNTP